MPKRRAVLRIRSVAVGVITALVLSSQALPQHLSTSAAAANVGGCSSGMCSGEKTNFCAQSGDACGSYGSCSPDPSGTMLCNPTPFCNSTGCTTVHGGTCY